MTIFRRSLLHLSLGAVVYIASGCNTPTLPLPPPSEPSVYLDNTEAVVQGKNHAVEPYAEVMCLNHSTDEAKRVQADETGSYVLRIPATSGDLLELWQRVGDRYSSSISIRIK